MIRAIEAVMRFMEENRRVVPAVAIIFALLCLLIYQWGSGYHAGAMEEIETLTEQYEMYRSVEARAGDLPTRTERARKDIEELEQGLLKADTEALGAALLQEAVKSTAAKRGIKMLSEKALSTIEAGEYTRIPVEFQFKSGLRQVKAFILDIESSELLMGVKSLSIRTPGGAGDRLEVTLVVEGAIRR